MTLIEYMAFSAPKARVLDRQFIKAFDRNVLPDLVDEFGIHAWVPTIPPMELGSESESTIDVDSDSQEKTENEMSPVTALLSGLEETCLGNT
jgi:hypothetical protein